MTMLMVNGAIVAAERATVPALDRGLTHGLGLYETVKVMGGTPVFFEEHLDRLARGLETLGIAPPLSREELASQVVRLSAADGVPDGACRILVTAGPPSGPATVIIALISQVALRSTADLKSKSVTTSYLAQQAAKASGADDAVFVDDAGRIHEATTANVFLCHGGGLLTAPNDGSQLPGVIRAKVIELAGADGIAVEQRYPTLAELAPADMLVLTSSVRGIVPAGSLDQRPLNVDDAFLERLRALVDVAETASAAAFRQRYGL